MQLGGSSQLLLNISQLPSTIGLAGFVRGCAFDLLAAPAYSWELDADCVFHRMAHLSIYSTALTSAHTMGEVGPDPRMLPPPRLARSILARCLQQRWSRETGDGGVHGSKSGLRDVEVIPDGGQYRRV